MADDPTPTEQTPPAPAPDELNQPADLGDAGKKAIDAMKAERDAAVKEKKAADRLLEQERTKNLSEAERAIAEAKQAARTEALTEVGTRLAKSEIRAAAATAGVDISADLPYLDLSQFVTSEGEPDDKAITAYIGGRAAATPKNPAVPQFDGGARTSAPTKGPDMNDLLRAALSGS